MVSSIRPNGDDELDVEPFAKKMGITPDELGDFLDWWRGNYPNQDVPKQIEELKSAYDAYKKIT